MKKLENEPILTLEEIVYRYPNEWVLIAYSELDDNLNVVRGKVLANSENRDDIYDLLLSTKDISVATKYTGKIPKNIAMVL